MKNGLFPEVESPADEKVSLGTRVHSNSTAFLRKWATPGFQSTFFWRLLFRLRNGCVLNDMFLGKLTEFEMVIKRGVVWREMRYA